jgi:hypothetical protein
MRVLIAWSKLVLSGILCWLALTTLSILAMMLTSPSGSPSAWWGVLIGVVPPIAAVFVGRRFAARDFQRINAARDSAISKASELRQAEFDAERWRARQFLHQEVDRHRAALQRNVRNALIQNDYGLVTSDRRTDAIQEFLRSIRFESPALRTDEAIAR